MFIIDADIGLRVLRESDAAELYALTDANRVFLRQWLPWLDVVTCYADTLAYLRTMAEQREQGRAATFGVLRSGALAGVVGFHRIDRVHRSGDIGYWLAESRQGAGVMTACCRFLVRYGFETLDLNRIQIAAATENRRSRAIPERLGFTLEGVLRQNENLYGTFVDHALYSLLRSDFIAARG